MIEHYVSLNETRHFTGSRLTMNVAANAQLHHVKLAFENASRATTLPITTWCWAGTRG